MESELQNKLFEKYPKIFKQKDLPMQQTSICWGIECGDGWYWLLDQLCNSIQRYIDGNKKPQLEAVQVKEKFGSLRFYSHGGDDIIFGMLWLAEGMSGDICERCGSTEEITQTKGWISTLCSKCLEDQDHAEEGDTKTDDGTKNSDS